jgi:outer membrane murein-binding lipoprotein Lpp
VLADKHGQNDEAEAELDELGARYADLFRDATAIARDVAAASANAARKKAVRETRAKVRRRMARQQPVETSSRGGLENLRSRVRRAASAVRRRIDDR